MAELRWDVRDILGAPRLAMEWQAIRTGMLGSLMAAVIAGIFTYGAVILDGSLPMFVASHPAPFGLRATGPRLGAVGLFLFVLGIALGLFVVIITEAALAKLLYRRLKGDVTFDAGAAWDYGRAHGRAVVFLLALLAVLLLAAFAIGLAASLVGRIPIVGDVWLGIVVLPGLVLALGTFAILATAVVILTIGPAVVGATDDDWLDLLIRCGSILWSQPWRWLLYEAIILAVTALTALFVAGLFAASLTAVLTVAGTFAPGKVLGMVLIASRYVPGLPGLLLHLLSNATVLSFAIAPATYVAGLLMALGVLLVLAGAAGYCMSVWASGQLIAYALLHRAQSGHDILAREDDIDRRAAIAAEPVPQQPAAPVPRPPAASATTTSPASDTAPKEPA